MTDQEAYEANVPDDCEFNETAAYEKMMDTRSIADAAELYY